MAQAVGKYIISPTSLLKCVPKVTLTPPVGNVLTHFASVSLCLKQCAAVITNLLETADPVQVVTAGPKVFSMTAYKDFN